MGQPKFFYPKLLVWISVVIALTTILLLGNWFGKQRKRALEQKAAEEKLINYGALVSTDRSSLIWRLTGTPRKKPRVSFDDVPTTDLELLAVKEMPCIGYLRIDNTKISDTGMKTIGHLTSLDKLDVRNLAITDDGLRFLKNLKKLKKLEIQNCDQISDAGLQHLYGLQNLESLYIQDCDQISDIGLKYLSSLENLKHLNIQGCMKVTQDGVWKLQQSLANTEIVWGEKKDPITGNVVHLPDNGTN